MKKNNKKIAYLIVKSILKELSPAESEEFKNWKAKPANKLLYNKLLTQKDFKTVNNRFDYLKSRKPVLKNQIKRKLLLHKLYNYGKYAAIVLIILTTSFFLLNEVDTGIDNLFPNRKKLPENVTLNSPVLKLSNGVTIILDENYTDINGIQVNIAKRQIRYNTGQLSINKSEIDTLITPKLCDYQYVFPDGSIAHMNSMSKLIFPKVFAPGEPRVVEIEGEIYFEVAKDERPFIVKSKDQTIKVLGTKFNINTYNNNSITTLVEGSVSISINADDLSESPNIILKPGEQSMINQSGISTREVNISDEIAWVRGEFIFRKHRLEDILNTLERWYDFEVTYENEKIKDYVFFVKVKKMESPEVLFNYLEEASDLEFDFKKNKLNIISI